MEAEPGFVWPCARGRGLEDGGRRETAALDLRAFPSKGCHRGSVEQVEASRGPKAGNHDTPRFKTRVVTVHPFNKDTISNLHLEVLEVLASVVSEVRHLRLMTEA